MKQWKRASLEMPCGAERACSILPDEPYLVLSGASGWRKVRCARHSGQAIPAVIPEPRPEAPRPVTVSTFMALKQLATRFDARKAAAGDED